IGDFPVMRTRARRRIHQLSFIDRRRTMRTVRWVLAALTVMVTAAAAVPSAAATTSTTATPTATAGSTVLNGIDLETATVLDLQAAMDARKLSSVHLTNFYLHRIREIDPLLNSVIETNPHALRDAAQSDVHRRRHGARSPLEGIPVLLKDNIDTADLMHTTAGSFALLGAEPARDAFLVGKLREAGAVILGKANLSEWANFRSLTSSSGW